MSHTHNTPPSNFSTADLPTDMAEGSVAFDTDTQELVAYKNGSWESLGSGGGIGSTTYVRDNFAGVIDQIQGDIPANWKQNDSSLKGLVIGTSCTSIGSSAFYMGTGLTGSLVIPDSVTTIGSSAFYLCNGLTGSLTIPNSVTSIGDIVFMFCTGLTAIYVNCPASSWIGSNALNGTTALVNIYYGPDTNGGAGYNATFQQGSGMTVSAWTNYPNIP